MTYHTVLTKAYLSFALTTQAASASGKKVLVAEKLINLDLYKICNWLLANKLSINVEKTECMIFATEYKLGQCPDLTVKINGSKLKQVDRKDYLRLTLNEKLK